MKSTIDLRVFIVRLQTERVYGCNEGTASSVGRTCLGQLVTVNAAALPPNLGYISLFVSPYRQSPSVRLPGYRSSLVAGIASQILCRFGARQPNSLGGLGWNSHSFAKADHD